MIRMENFLVALALLVLATIAGAQQQKSPSAKAGVVSGSVFAITGGGDLKPARMADVYLLYKYRSVKVANANPEDMDSAGMAWMDNLSKTLEEHTKALAAEGMGWSDKMDCLKSLQVYHDALSQTRDWASAKHKGWQILTTEADENGVFKIAVPHPGIYTILASGHAGFNDAFWYDMMELGVVVNPGATTTVKLSSPAKSCLTD